MDSFVEQLKTVLADQRQELMELRRDRKEAAKRKAELDAEEIDIILGIRKTKETLEKVSEGDGGN